MKSTFSRTFTTVVILLLAVLLLTGISFQLLVEDYLEKEAVARLERNGKVIAELVEFSATGDTLSSRDFNIALSMVASVSDMDTVICDASGRQGLCPCTLGGTLSLHPAKGLRPFRNPFRDLSCFFIR